MGNKQKTPRIWKSHQPLNNFPAATIGDKSKILHIIRNPKDVVCSYYDFFRKEPLVNYQGSFDTLFDWYCDGSVVHSSIFEFELNWFRALRDGKLTKKQLLIISYEDIVRKPTEVIKKVATFLGYDMNEEQIESVADAISFSRSKKEAQAKSGIAAIVNRERLEGGKIFCRRNSRIALTALWREDSKTAGSNLFLSEERSKETT